MEAIYKTSPQQADATRKAMLQAIDTRCQFEEKTSNAQKTIKQLERIAKRIERLDYRAISYIAAKELDFDAYVNSSKQNGTRANIYSIPKYLELCSVLNAGSFLHMNGGEHATIAATLVALHNDCNVQKTLAFEVNSIMSGIRRFQAMRGDSSQDSILAGIMLGKIYSYANGMTQGGSSLRALEALGIVREVMRDGSCKVWTFAEANDETKTLVKKAYAALASNMFQSEQDKGYIKETALAPIVPEDVWIEVLNAVDSAIPDNAAQVESVSVASNMTQEERDAIQSETMANSDGMGLMLPVSVPEKKGTLSAAIRKTIKKDTQKQENAKISVQSSLINILDSEAMEAEAERQKAAKKAIASAKRKATLAAKKKAAASK